MLLSQKLINKRVIYLLGDHWGVTRFTLRMSAIMFHVTVDQMLTPGQERDRKSASLVIHFVSTSSDLCYYLKNVSRHGLHWNVMDSWRVIISWLSCSMKAAKQCQPSLSIYTRCIQARYVCLGQLCFSSVHSSTHNHCSYMHTTKPCLAELPQHWNFKHWYNTLRKLVF